MKRALGLVIFAALTLAYVVYALIQPLAALQPHSTFAYKHAAEAVTLSWPSYGSAAVGAAGYGVLESNGSSKPAATASTIKVLTALTILRKYPLQSHEQGPTITLGAADVASYTKFAALNGSLVHVRLGERLTEYQALQALLLPSANNIAETLARWAYGSIDNFNEAANQYAHELGMTHTIVTDPSGFAPETVSNPHDLVLLGEAVLNEPVIAEIVQQPSTTLPVEGTVRNYNALLGQDGIIGIKTGNNDQNPGCYMVASKQTVDGQKVTIIAVIMNGPNLWRTMQDSLPLIKSVAKGFGSVRIATPSTAIAAYRPAWQTSVAVSPSQAVNILAWKGSEMSVSVVASSLQPDAKAGHQAGTLSVHNSLQDKDIIIPLTLSHDISSPSIWWRLTHPASSRMPS